VDALLRHCFPIDILDNDSNTPLHLATKYGHLITVKCLVQFGAQLIPNKEGKLPQQIALEQNHPDIIQYFQAHLATWSKPMSEGPLDAIPQQLTNRNQKRLVVGICGATCSGKSTLTRSFVEHFNCKEPYHRLDSYWKLANEMRRKMGFVDGESPDCLRMDDFIMSLERRKQAASEDQILFVDGFLLYSNPKLMELLDVKIFISVSKQTCFARRLARNPGTSKHYFEKIIWPSYLQYNSIYVNSTCGILGDNVLIMDGERNKEEVFQEAVHYLQQKLQSYIR